MVYNEENKNKWTKDKRHYYFKCYYTDMYGNRKQYQSKMYLTSKEAKEAEIEFLSKVNKEDIPDSNITFEQVYNEWLTIKLRTVKSTSAYTIKLITNKYILSYFKNYKLNSIRTNNINDWFKYIASFKTSLKHQNKSIGYLIEILKFATINYNYDAKIITRITPYKIEKASTIKDSEWNYWTYEEFKKFINVVDDDFYKLIFNFLYFTGLRFGEFDGLTWEKIDLEKKYLKIDSQLTIKTEGKGFKIITPKSKNSIRIVQINNELVEMLKMHKINEKKIYGFNEKMFVFGNVKYISHTTLARKLDYYINLANVKRITIHGFKHSHVSLLIYLGCDSREVAARVGDTVEEIEKTYYHMFPEKKEHTINLLNNLKL